MCGLVGNCLLNWFKYVFLFPLKTKVILLVFLYICCIFQGRTVKKKKKKISEKNSELGHIEQFFAFSCWAPTVDCTWISSIIPPPVATWPLPTLGLLSNQTPVSLLFSRRVLIYQKHKFECLLLGGYWSYRCYRSVSTHVQAPEIKHT